MSDPGIALLVLTILLTAISTTTTAVRIGVKTVQRLLRWEDWTILLAMILLLTQVAFIGLQYREGSGSHIWTLTQQQRIKVLEYVYITEFLLFAVVCFPKFSICFFVLRIKNAKKLRWSLYFLMAGSIVTTGMCEIVLFAQCRPIYVFWDRTAGVCWDSSIYNNVIWVQVSFSIFSDFMCTLLLVVVLWNVKIALRLKFAVWGLMSLGLLATICAGVRASLSNNDQDPDLTYSLAFISIWAVLEAHLGIIAANLALSRYVWLFFKRSSDISQQYQRPDSFQREAYRRHKPMTRLEDSLFDRSHDIEIPPASHAIRKTTTFQILEETWGSSGQSAYGDQSIRATDVV
ncbi:hypothetical protein MMC17_009079 [Xylographa soralifera]|nr:hypothetical protein [Xylographa soralifera]